MLTGPNTAIEQFVANEVKLGRKQPSVLPSRTREAPLQEGSRLHSVPNPVSKCVIVISDDDNDEDDSRSASAIARHVPHARHEGRPTPTTATATATTIKTAGPAPAPAPAVATSTPTATPRAITARRQTVSSPNRRRSTTLPRHSPAKTQALVGEQRRAANPRSARYATRTGASRCFRNTARPYIRAARRAELLRGVQGLAPRSELPGPHLLHVDFSPEESQYLLDVAKLVVETSGTVKAGTEKRLARQLKKNRVHFIPRILEKLETNHSPVLTGRSSLDIQSFLWDFASGRTAAKPGLLTLEQDVRNEQAGLLRSGHIHSLLLAREIAGHGGYSAMRQPQNFVAEFKKWREDALDVRQEWTGCAGDIATISWVSHDAFVCGTTEHSDPHNQQYNKPGNLVLGSCSRGTLRAYPDHRIVRPIVSQGDNASNAMRQSQDSWLYSSVVSSDYDSTHDRAYTSGFDRAVKVWRVQETGAAMELLGEWKHHGNVNFVMASKHESGMVATAADVPADAVRVYDVNESDVSASQFRSYSCSRITDIEGNTVHTDKWAYFPATMRWGLAPGCTNLLLVGYSPRSLTGDDNDIPEDRVSSGELCLWDCSTGERWRLTSATTQNCFEVLWHPTRSCFIAATSPLGLDLESSVRTQIRIFHPVNGPEFGGKAFGPVKTLDCYAVDINELSIEPNTARSSYITAGCTDGNVYVWDSGLSGQTPIHILRHGYPLEEFCSDREEEDTGVKFTAWGSSPDRFYTGSSDGIVKVWNVRSRGCRPLVRNLLEAPAPISHGAFSPDRSRLLIGDASGRVFMLSLDEDDEKPGALLSVRFPGQKTSKTVRRPRPVIPHPEPPPPVFDADGKLFLPRSGPELGHMYLEAGQLQRHPNPTIGVVQGPNYAATGLFMSDAHAGGDPSEPLMASFACTQQQSVKMFPSRIRTQFIPQRPIRTAPDIEAQHARNLSLDLDFDGLDEETKLSLEQSGVDLAYLLEYIFNYEE